MASFPDYSKIIVQPLPSFDTVSNVRADMLRLDLLHPEISGNKWFKLKYNLTQAEKEKNPTILTFGGGWSNHIAATAAACHLLGFKSIGIIRGEELKPDSTPTLTTALHDGMQLHFISRERYREKEKPDYINSLNKKFDFPYIIPEGGNNKHGIKGCKEILSFCKPDNYTHICCAVGTGATLTGIIESASFHHRILGFPVLKATACLKERIEEQLDERGRSIRWELITPYHFGGFAKKTRQLLDFMKDFDDINNIRLDLVYTAKMMFGIADLIGKNYFPAGSRILTIHTGGLQGNKSLTKQQK